MSDRLSEIEERLAAATPGPWEECANLPSDGPMYYSVDTGDGEVCSMEHTPQGAEDMRFIANAPADIAALVAFAREMEARHRPVHQDWVRLGDQICEECTDSADYAAGSPGVGWPCPTAQAIQRLGSAA